ncbi:MAG: 4-(cytidine 5'-diphospho)-2-C-methyl-D-erythritol kinase [Proteobacteria bacterium]|nr:4-(cytidine 5'-diphospho)-2-C-methyl-D-erythritol kinase [Pseudomonadota bacterium]HQR03884.1 4-(cytidine 5'-diphospho)-2-C-methyl-D-erythritol kinase [Rhodocyclaceae bacterium]
MAPALSAPGWHEPWPAPAKLNLFLQVVGRRADGYHLLQTVFTFIDAADTLYFEPRHDGRIVLANPLPGVAMESDLTVRAAAALRAAAGITHGVTLTLEKRLPMGGGLGGGSSDAASALLALNHLWRCNLSRPALQNLGLTLGADVPVFIHGRSTFAEGVGERFTDVAVSPAWYLVLVPPVAVPTAAIFAAPDLRRNAPALTAAGWRAGMGRNDLEPVACRLYPEVARHLAWLRDAANAGHGCMSGSGACCFATCADEAAAHDLLARLPRDMRGFVARGLPAHPLAHLT